MLDYYEFLKRKVAKAESYGFDISPDEANPILKPHQKASVVWAVKGGRRALFASYGLGKTLIQLEVLRIILERTGGMGLIVMPLGVRGEFMRDAKMIGIAPKFIRRTEEIQKQEGIYLTNYESVRDGKLDPRPFSVSSLDEAACLRSAGGSATFRACMATLAGDKKTMSERVIGEKVDYRFIATACPSPNSYEELLVYAAYLGVLDISQGKTRFFKRDSVHADRLTLYPHKADEFFLWLGTWSLWMERPSDICSNCCHKGVQPCRD